jgi:hypothetical protein
VLALSIRQPFAELILRGIKTAELRGRPTKIVGQRFYIYAAKKKLPVDSCQLPVKAWSSDLQVGHPPAWMIELAEQIKLLPEGIDLPTGVIVGSAVIEKIIPPFHSDDLYQWVLTDVRRLHRCRKPARHPQPVWFRPF